jgi:hypothetical protein
VRVGSALAIVSTDREDDSRYFSGFVVWNVVRLPSSLLLLISRLRSSGPRFVLNRVLASLSSSYIPALAVFA